MNASLFGFLNLNKPRGWSSRAAVDRVQKIVWPEKVGHAGTLDPLATGVLVVGMGQATRLVEYLQQQPKGYVGTFLLGRESDTEDIEGHVIPLEQPPVPTLEQIESLLPRFTGEIDQMPPAFSALKVEGRRAYQFARKGLEVKLDSRRIHIHSLAVEAYAYPELRLRITCGSGTYIRSLGRDLARALGTGAVMSALVRTFIGSFTLEQSISPETLDRAIIERHLLPSQWAVSHLPSMSLSDQEVIEILHGRTIPLADWSDSGERSATDSTGRLIAILAPSGSLLRPVRVFPPA